MDFGFDGFLEKFEQHFGRRWTKALLILIGLAISSACLGVIWQFLIAPVLAFFQAPGRVAMLANLITAGAAIGAGSLFALRIYDWYQGRKLGVRRSRRAVEAQIKATEALLDALEDKRDQ